MFDITINYWSVVAATIASVILGVLWYNKALFGKQWMKMSGLPDKKPEGQGKMMLFGFISTFVQAFVLANIVGMFGGGVGAGLQAGFWMWLGFQGTLTLGSVLWERKPFQLWVLNNGYNLIALLLMGLILGYWA